MSEYIITIVPVVRDDAVGPVTQTVVRVDSAGGAAVVKELTFKSAEDAPLAGAELPYVDFETLLRAFVPADDAQAPRQAPAGAAPGRAAPARRPAAKARSARAGQPRDRAVNPLQAGRAYRRAPDLATLEAAYMETGSINGLAQRFGVPVHTAQGWVSRMRRRNARPGTAR